MGQRYLTTRHCLTAVLLLAGLAGVMPAGRATAATLDLVFEPPELDVGAICVPRASDADLSAHWAAWDGTTLPDRDAGLIARDTRRLMEMDPARWGPVAEKVNALIADTVPGYTKEKVTMARIDLLVAQGRLQDLKAERLVQSLLDGGIDTSPRLQNTVAEFLIKGVGIDRDVARGTQLLMDAGYGGNADALLELSRMALAGQAPADWTIDPELSVSMALGALVGQLDPLICDRISRIAREYRNGDIVTQDYVLSERWFRLAADLGDPVAAWNVAEYHMQSENLVKDNAILINYLIKAADGGLPYAQLALGRVYEVGALGPLDPDKALSIYQTAAKSNERASLVRLVLYIESRLKAEPDLKPQHLEALHRLAAVTGAPGWAFSKLANEVLDSKGRWAGEAEAVPLLQKAADLDDGEARRMLSQIQFRTVKTEAAFYEIVDRMIYSVTNLGIVEPMTELGDAYLCKAPGAPMQEQAQYWRDLEAASGSPTPVFSKEEFDAMLRDPDPFMIALLQTQALYGRPNALANFLAYLENSGATPEELAFWTSYSERFAGIDASRGRVELKLALTPEERQTGLDTLRQGYAAGDTDAGLVLVDALLSGGLLTPELTDEMNAVLRPIAAKGSGEAMALLLRTDPATYPSRRALYEAFHEVIAARGDFAAILLALPFQQTPGAEQDYTARAVSAMTCDFNSAVAFAGASNAVGNPDEAQRWLKIAAILGEGSGFSMVTVGDEYLKLFGTDGAKQANDFFQKAYASGNRTAIHRLLAISASPRLASYDPVVSAQLYTDLIARSNVSEIPDVLEGVSKRSAEIQTLVAERVDLQTLYATSAQAGEPVAMREYALLLRDAADTAQEIESSTDWLIKASDRGDVQAMMALSQSYAMGLGVAPSLAKARSWMEQAAKAGDPEAQKLYNSMTLGEAVTQ